MEAPTKSVRKQRHFFQIPFKRPVVLRCNRRLMRYTMSRLSDLLIACCLILLTLPLMILVALAVKCDSRGLVFYRQERIGLGGRRFMLLKFRSMIRDAEPGGRPVWAAEHDNRVTRIGRFIRPTRIDELPQLLNVLRGDMSMIGPRPERPYFVERLNEIIPSFTERHSIKPGITGWAQVMEHQSMMLVKSLPMICTILRTVVLCLI
jgi:lipopolysaccharide/colanic/teichoic acid biosynthesis glycosyltransferase